MADKTDIQLTLSQDEALVFYGLLTRLEDTDAMRSNDLIEHQSEERVLWDLLASLEKVLVQPFAQNYDALMAAARERVKDTE